MRKKEETMIEAGTQAADFTLDSHLGVPFRLGLCLSSLPGT